jgi:CRP/FNR family transcriptional regulator, cyclic AMP receptor protein
MPVRESSDRSLEDALAYLPCSAIQEFAKGMQIYGPGDTAAALYLVIGGRIKLSRISDTGVGVVVDIYHADDFFGESALLKLPRDAEQAIALESTKVMTWSTQEIETLIEKEPRLAVALMQVVVKRSVDFKGRLESFSVEGTVQRLARALLHFADRMGGEAENGAVTIAPLTHELLAQYVGTSREIISHHMAEFRSKGYIRYSRKGITIHGDTMNAWLKGRAKHA